MPARMITTPLGDLRWHWGDAYIINGTVRTWLAERRDNRRVLRADDPAKLRQVIIADYTGCTRATARTLDHRSVYGEA
jgi:hypothetical protein